MEKQNVYELIEGYMQSSLSAGQEKELLQIVEERKEIVIEVLNDMMGKEPVLGNVQEDTSKMLSTLQQVLLVDKPRYLIGMDGGIFSEGKKSFPSKMGQASQSHRLNNKGIRVLKRNVVAGFIAFALITGAWLWLFNIKNNKSDGLQSSIQPGENKASLLLPDGREIDLNAKDGKIVVRDSVFYEDGKVVATAGKGNTQNQLLTLRTPAGGQYQVQLPDGTKVWLNAASVLQYPAKFDGAERKVFLEGEAYFEVAKMERKNKEGKMDKVPFKVFSKEQYVEVLGTKFNISTYKDDGQVKTTLMEGSVKVVSIDTAWSDAPKTTVNNILLKPGQESLIGRDSIKVTDVDARLRIDWKEGVFSFRKETLRTIMNKVARWYQISVKYNDGVEDRRFSGDVSRYDNIDELLGLLSQTGEINYTVTGNTITLGLAK